MGKIARGIILIIVLAMLWALLVGCSGRDSQMVGRWNAGYAYYVFNADGTGYVDYGRTINEFTWRTSGSRLTIRGEYKRGSYRYNIDGRSFWATGVREDYAWELTRVD